MKYAILFALLLSSCRAINPVEAAVGGAELFITLNHIDDSPEEYIAWIDSRLERSSKWCRNKEQSACLRKAELLKERAAFLKTGMRGDI